MAARLTRLVVALGLLLGAAQPSAAAAVVSLPGSFTLSQLATSFAPSRRSPPPSPRGGRQLLDECEPGGEPAILPGGDRTVYHGRSRTGDLGELGEFLHSRQDSFSHEGLNRATHLGQLHART